MSIELIGFMTGLLVLLIFGFIYSLHFTEKVSLNERIAVSTLEDTGYRVSNSEFGKLYKNAIQNKVSDRTIDKLAILFGVNVGVLQDKIELVGMEEYISAVEIVVLKVLGVIAGLVLGIGAFSVKNMPFAIVAFIAFVALFFMPEGKISDKEKERENAVIRELPKFIEECYLCIESGASLRESLEFVASRTQGILGKNFQEAFVRSKYTGRWENEVIEMASVLRVNALEEFINDILIANEKGVSIHDTLRKEVENIGMLKRANDKERVGALGTKVLIPMMIFFIIPMFVIVMAPALIQCMQMLG